MEKVKTTLCNHSTAVEKEIQLCACRRERGEKITFASYFTILAKSVGRPRPFLPPRIVFF